MVGAIPYHIEQLRLFLSIWVLVMVVGLKAERSTVTVAGTPPVPQVDCTVFEESCRLTIITLTVPSGFLAAKERIPDCALELWRSVLP